MGLSKVIDLVRLWFWSAVVWALWVQNAWAASEKLKLDTEIDPVATPMPSTFSVLVKLMVSLLLVGGLAYLTIKFLRKNSQVMSSSESISILDQFAMGMNKGLFIVEIAGKVLVLGVTDHNINTLYEITDASMVDELRAKASERQNQPFIPPRFWEAIRAKSQSLKKQESSFSSHIQEQIKKLRVTAEGSKLTEAGKDEGHEQNGR